MHTSCRCKSGIALAALALGTSACERPRPQEALALRCLEALQVHEPELGRVEVLAFDHPSPADRRLRFEAQIGAAKLRVEDEIRCRFEAGDAWALRAIALGDRALSEGEVALVNSELLLRDLSEHPERLAQHVVAVEASDPPAAPATAPPEPEPQAFETP